MTGPQQLTILVHAALQRAGYSPVASSSSGGYIVAEHKTLLGQSSEVEVSHVPLSDAPDAHARAYYSALVADHALAGLAIQFVPQPYPKVSIRR